MIAASAADFRPPAAERYALIGAAGTILPGGRLLRPLGTQIETGPGPLALALSQNGTVATADTGPERLGVTVIEPPGKTGWRERHIWARTPHSPAPEIADPDWKGVAGGIAFEESGKMLWVSEGASGRIRQIDWNSADTRKIVDLNSGEWRNSFAGEIASDGARRLLYIADRNNSRLAVVDTKLGRVVSSVTAVGQPSAIALAPDNATAYATTADSLCAIDVQDALKPELTGCVPVDSPAGVIAAAGRVFVSSGRGDSITVLDAHSRNVLAEIPLRIPSLESLRGIEPAGMAYDPVTKWLLVAETGINAVGVVDTGKNQLIGHLPAGWMPTRVAISGDRVYIANKLGRGTGPNNRRVLIEMGEVPSLHHGTVTTFFLPDASEIIRHTGTVFINDGFVPWMHDPAKPPESIRHVVLIANEGRTFDEVLGDVVTAGNGRVVSFAKLARFGMHGSADGGKVRFSVQDARVTPNQHAIAQQWAFSDNFYLDEEDAGGDLWRHLEKNGVSFRRFDDAGRISNQARADRFIAALDNQYGKDGEPLPQFLYIHLPDNQASEAYPFEASRVEDDDLAVGRILEYLSHSRWWPEMEVFVTDAGTQGGLDHVDSHRTVLLAAGPYVRRNYVSHTNSDFAGLRRTIFELLHVPPTNLIDATAAGLQDLFTSAPDPAPFVALPPDSRIFDPSPVP